MADEIKPEVGADGKPVVQPKQPEAGPKVDTSKPLGEALGEKAEAPAEAKTVPEAVFLDEKAKLKDAKAKIAELEALAANGGNKTEIATKLKDLAKKFPELPEEFVTELGTTLSDEVTAQAEAIAKKEVAPFKERENAATTAAQKAHIDTTAKELYDASIENMPDFKEIADFEVIKNLSLLPVNAKKTMPQIIEETYGRAVAQTGSKPIADTRPGGGKDPQPVDVDRARRDPKYFDEIMANPTLKKEYNDQAFTVKRRR